MPWLKPFYVHVHCGLIRIANYKLQVFMTSLARPTDRPTNKSTLRLQLQMRAVRKHIESILFKFHANRKYIQWNSFLICNKSNRAAATAFYCGFIFVFQSVVSVVRFFRFFFFFLFYILVSGGPPILVPRKSSPQSEDRSRIAFCAQTNSLSLFEQTIIM